MLNQVVINNTLSINKESIDLLVDINEKSKDIFISIFDNIQNNDDFISVLSEAVENEIENIEDLTKKKNRDKLVSFSAKIKKIKTRGDEFAKSQLEDYKKVVDQKNVLRRNFREKLEILADKVRQPVTDLEELEKNQNAIKAELQSIHDTIAFLNIASDVALFDQILSRLLALNIDIFNDEEKLSLNEDIINLTSKVEFLKNDAVVFIQKQEELKALEIQKQKEEQALKDQQIKILMQEQEKQRIEFEKQQAESERLKKQLLEKEKQAAIEKQEKERVDAENFKRMSDENHQKDILNYLLSEFNKRGSNKEIITDIKNGLIKNITINF